MTNPGLELEGIGFSYGVSRLARQAGAPPLPLVLDGVSVSFERACFTAVIGPNGCGKSTLLKLIAGILTPRTGAIRLDGAVLSEMTPRERARRIAYVPQQTTQVFPFTALEVVLTGRSPYHARFRFENPRDRQIALEALASIDAESLAHRPVTELSGGERQMVSVARALAQNADIVLLDEPAASLDLKHRARLLSALERLREERELTAIVVTHDLQLLDSRFDALVALKNGRVHTSGASRDVLRAEMLADVYEDPGARTAAVEGRTFVWSEW